MITKDIEAKLVGMVEQAFANLPKHTVFGMWQVANQGALKNVEDASAVAAATVALGLPASTTFSSGEITFNGSISLVVRLDLDTDGTAAVAFGAALENLFKELQADTYQRKFAELDVPGVSIDEISIGSGQPPSISDNRFAVAFPFTISGSYRPTTQTTQTT